MNWLLTLHVDETVVTEMQTAFDRANGSGCIHSCTEFRMEGNSPITSFKNPAETMRFNVSDPFQHGVSVSKIQT